jgi:hypothetical protein
MGNNQAKIERLIAMRKRGDYCKGEYRWFPQSHPNSFNPLWLGKNKYRTVEVDDWGHEIIKDSKYWYNDYDRLRQIPMYAHRRMKDKKRTIYRNRDRQRKNNFVRVFLNQD